MFLIMSCKLFQIIPPEYCKDQLKSLLLALGRNNLIVQHEITRKTIANAIVSLDGCA